MDGDDVGVIVVGVFVVFYLIVMVLVLLVGIAVSFSLGVLSNLALRAIANDYEWSEIDEWKIWVVVVVLLLTPLFFGLIFFAADGPVWLIPAYLVWVAGYFFAWWNPMFERGQADVLMSSTLILAWTKFQIWWGHIMLRSKLEALRLGIIK